MENLRFLHYLIYELIRTVLLFREGINVLVLFPERFAILKLIVSSRRVTDTIGHLKVDKHLTHTALLFEALVQTRQGDELTDGWEEA